MKKLALPKMNLYYRRKMKRKKARKSGNVRHRSSDNGDHALPDSNSLTSPQRVTIDDWIQNIKDSREENTRRVSEIEKNHQKICLMHQYIDQRITALERHFEVCTSDLSDSEEES